MISAAAGARVPSVLAFAMLVLLAVMAQPWAQEVPAVGHVSRFTGEVSVLRGADRLAPSTGTLLYEGDAIATGPHGRAEIAIGDGSTVTVGAGTTVSVVSFAAAEAGPGRAFLDLIEGILRIALSGERPWHSFDVRSATAVASVRSTHWIVDATRVKTGVLVVEGDVAVSSRAGAGEVTLSAGQGTDVLLGRAPTAPKAWGQARVDDVLARTRMP